MPRFPKIYRNGNNLYCRIHGQLRFSAYSRGAFCDKCRDAERYGYQRALMEQSHSGRGIRRRRS